MRLAEQALETARDAKLTETEADCRRVLGILRTRTGEYLEAESQLREAVDLYLQVNVPYGESLSLLELGKLYAAMASSGDFTLTQWRVKAMDTLAQAADKFEKLGARYDLSLATSASRYASY